MQRRHGLGWDTQRIAAQIGCNRETMQRYLAVGGWTPCQVPTRPGLLAGHMAWLDERLRCHRGNADVVSLRTVERAVSHPRRELAAEALATLRFETPSGRQLQIDFGQRRIAIDNEAFRYFSGLPGELLLDNVSALDEHHDPVTREVEFNSRLHAFTRYWDVRPVACAPSRAGIKG